MITADTLVARHHILNALALHSRGVDRADAPLLGAAYHDDATVDYGFFAGDAATLVAILAEAQKAGGATLHRTSNCWIKVDGDAASAESYVIAYAEAPNIQRIIMGRYLDRLALRDGAWRLTHRTYVLEANVNRPGASAFGEPSPTNDHFVPTGGKGAADPGRALLAHHAAAARGRPRGQAMTNSAYDLDAALARAEIHDLAMAYCRGVDRADEELIASIFTPDSAVVTGVINGTGAEFATTICQFVREELELCFHSVANEWIEVDGEEAVGELYAIAHMIKDGQEMTTGGRYLDRYVRRDGRWLIKSRTFVTDWNMSYPSTLERGGFYEALNNWGKFGREDPVYAHWVGADA